MNMDLRTSIPSTEFDLMKIADGTTLNLGVRVSAGVELPLFIRRAGDGPVVLVVGGTHGDEFEGQIVVGDLARKMNMLEMNGTLICLPRHNVSGCLAGTRCRPIDQLDLNRAYGRRNSGEVPDDTINFVTDKLFPYLDWLIDIHSGGSAHEFVLSANVQAEIGSDDDTEMRPFLEAFAAPFSIVFDDIGTASMPHVGTLEAAARNAGVRAFSSELGGAERVSVKSMQVARRGIANLLSHIGLLEPEIFDPAKQEPILLRLDKPEHYVFADSQGIIEPKLEIGTAVKSGDCLAHLHPDDLGDPIEISALCDGVFSAVQAKGRCNTHEPAAIVCEYLQPIKKP